MAKKKKASKTVAKVAAPEVAKVEPKVAAPPKQKEKKSVSTVEDKLNKLQKAVNEQSAKIRRMSDNWKRYVKLHVDTTSDGTIAGFARPALLAGAFAVLLVTIGLIGAYGVIAPAGYGVEPQRANWVTAAISNDGTFVTEGDLVVGGSVGIDDLTASGNLTVSSNAAIEGVINAGDAVNVDGIITASNNVVIKQDLDITGTTEMNASFTNKSVTRLEGVVTTAGDVDNDATGGSTADPDFGVDGYQHNYGVLEVDGNILADGAIVGDGATTIGGVAAIKSTGILTVSNNIVTANGGDLDIAGSAEINGIVTAKVNIVAEGNILGDGATAIHGIAAINSTGILTVSNNIVIANSGDLDVAGSSELNGIVTAKVDIVAEGNIVGDGATAIHGIAAINSTGILTVSNNIVTANGGDLDIAGSSELNGIVTAKVDIVAEGNIVGDGATAIHGIAAINSTGILTVSNNVVTADGGDLYVAGTSEMTGIQTNKAAVEMESTLAVTDVATLTAGAKVPVAGTGYFVPVGDSATVQYQYQHGSLAATSSAGTIDFPIPFKHATAVYVTLTPANPVTNAYISAAATTASVSFAASDFDGSMGWLARGTAAD